MTERDAALGLLLGDCLYEDFIVVLHLAGFGTRMSSINECYVFDIKAPNEFDGRLDWTYEYIGNFKVQGDEILVSKRNEPYTRFELSDPKLYHNVFGFFGKPEWEIELFLDNRRHYQNFLQSPKVPKDGVEGSG